MADTIRLKKDNILRFAIEDSEGNLTGEHLEFDLEDVELLLRYQEMLEQHKKNENYLKMQKSIIEKKENKQGKKLLSTNEEEELKTVKEYFTREMAAVDLFLGKDGCKKLLNGRKPYLRMFDDIDSYVNQIIPVIEKRAKTITDQIKSKYSNNAVEEDNILE